jgi:hypothetical protein
MYFTQAFGGAFYVTWLPTYLAERGLTGATAGVLAGMPLIMSSAADLVGGVATDRAVRRLGLRLGRITIGGGALAAAGLFTLAGALAESPWPPPCSSPSAADRRISAWRGWGTCCGHRPARVRRGERGDEFVRTGRLDPSARSWWRRSCSGSRSGARRSMSPVR